MIDLTRERALSVKQVVKQFDVSRRTVENWFSNGLEKTRIGRRVYTSLQAIQRFSQPGIEIEVDSDTEADELALDAMGCKET